MPTKHKRKRDDDKFNHDLPPTSRAKPLPVIAPTKDFLTPRKKQKVDGGKTNRHKKSTDDTPKAFARLMAWHKDGKKIGGGLDDGAQARKKKQRQQNDAAKNVNKKTDESSEPPVEVVDKSIPKIQPGETLAEYSVRIDQALPLSSLEKHNVNPNKSLPPDLLAKEKKSKPLTKHNKRLARMQAEWRNTEAKLKSKEEEEAEENEEKLEEERLLWEGVKTKGKKGKRRVVEDDPWQELEKKRRDEHGKKNLALTARDQAQAPPTLGKVKNIFKERPMTAPSSRLGLASRA